MYNGVYLYISVDCLLSTVYTAPHIIQTTERDIPINRNLIAKRSIRPTKHERQKHSMGYVDRENKYNNSQRLYTHTRMRSYEQQEGYTLCLLSKRGVKEENV